jgi:3-oxoacyl-[acyl-carrier protein] reductase
MTDALTDEQKTKMFERIPAGRFGSGADIAAAVLWLASDEGGYVTGQAVHVNGGMHMA